MKDFSEYDSERLCSYHEKLIDRGHQLPERIIEIEQRRSEILIELEKRAKKNEFVRPQQGLLSFYGYRVGSAQGKKENSRRATLKKIFYEEKLPIIGSLAYVKEWGNPCSNERLKKMKNCLTGFINADYPKYLNMERAFKEWQSDLDWLNSEEL